MSSTTIPKNITKGEILPLLTQYLKKCAVAGPVVFLSKWGINGEAFEEWILALLAGLFYEVHRHPSVCVPGFSIRFLSDPERRLAKFLYRLYVPRLFQFGWLIRDPTQIVLVDSSVGDQIDSWTYVNRFL
jgi:hypothetical protein